MTLAPLAVGRRLALDRDRLTSQGRHGEPLLFAARLPRMVARWVERALARLDVGVYRLSAVQGPADALDIGFLPSVDQIIDVGVAHGTPWLYAHSPCADLLLVDPVPKHPRLDVMLGERPYTFLQLALEAESTMTTVTVDLDQPSRSYSWSERR